MDGSPQYSRRGSKAVTRIMRRQWRQFANFLTLEIVNIFEVIAAFLLLFEPRYSKKVYFASLIPFMVLWIGGNLYILLAHGLEVQERYTLLTATLPSLLYFWVMDKNRDGRFFSRSVWWIP